MEEKDITTSIQISKRLAKKIKSLKITKLETYEEIITRLFEFYKENKK